MAFPNKIVQTNDLLNYYLTMNMDSICRICLEKSNKLTPIFDPIKPPHFSVLITACASVQVQQGDGLPPYICQKCISRLNIAFQFKTQCESSDTKLRQCFENYSLSPAPAPDYSVSYGAKEKNVNKANHTPTEAIVTQNKHTQIDKVPEKVQYVEESISEQHIYVQEQSEENKYETDITAIQVESLQDDQYIHKESIELEEYKVDYKVNEDVCQQDNSTIKIEDLNIGQILDNNLTTGARKSKRPLKVHQCNTCGKIFKTKPSLVHHIRIHTGERPYVCHLCQKRFINGGHLHTHMKTHTGEKNHICSGCNKGFATTQQLTKHTIAIHTSERPYGCTYCPKRFASSSNLNTHIKIHTGEKNFHCEVCGKTFSTKGQLQQHMLVHTGEKAFLCEYCDKSFSQKAHLSRHLRTHNRTE